MKTEKRYLPTEVRASEDGKITGYAAVFYRADDPGTEFELYPGMVERIVPGAFDRAIAEDDVRGLVNHQSSAILGRTTAGTMRLAVDDIGLRYEIDTPPTQLGRDTAVSIQRGDITGSSFAFAVDKGGESFRSEGGREIRELRSLRLFDVGPVAYPAYEATSTSARDLQSAIEAARESRDEEEPIDIPAAEVTPDPQAGADADILSLKIKIAQEG